MFNQPKNDDLNDALSDLIGGVDETKAANPVQPPEHYVPGAGRPNKFKESRIYTEICRKCGGSGLYRAPSSHGHRCFECDGAGKKTFKTSPEHRAAQRSRKVTKAQEAAAAVARAAAEWLAAKPEVAAWFVANGNNGFAQSLFAKLNQYGSLTDGQLAAVHNSIERDKNRVAEAAKRIESAPVADAVGVDRLKTAFDTAKAYAEKRGRGIRNLRLTIGGVVISPAPATGNNPGALYVKTSGGSTYLGKIAKGKFFAARECTEADERRVLAFVADPKAAAIAYGQETGVCCVCNAQLTNEESIQAGIGPICAEKFGW